MIKKVRKKFTLIAMAAMIFWVILLIGSINLLNYQQVNKRLTKVMEELAERKVGKTAGNNRNGNANMQSEMGRFVFLG